MENHPGQKPLAEMGGTPPQWAKSGGEAVQLELSDFTKDPM